MSISFAELLLVVCRLATLICDSVLTTSVKPAMPPQAGAVWLDHAASVTVGNCI